MKNILRGLLGFVSILAITWAFNFMQYFKKQTTVGVLLSDAMYYHEKTYQGFIDRFHEVAGGRGYSIKPFYFRGFDQMNIKSMAQALIEFKPDIAVSLGSMGSMALAELRRKRQVDFPQVFTGVTNSAQLGLVDTLEVPGGTITGVMTGGYEQLIMPNLLRIAKPDVERVLIPFDASDDPDGFSTATAQAISDYLMNYGIESTLLPVDGVNEAVKMISNVIGEYDVVMGLEVDSLVDISPALVKLCREKGVTFFAASVEGVEAGAVFSFGSQPLFVGRAGFDIVRDIVEQKKDPATIPVLSLRNTRQFIINTTYAAEQAMPDIDPVAIKARMAADPLLAPFLERVVVL